MTRLIRPADHVLPGFEAALARRKGGDAMIPEDCVACLVPWGQLPEDHSAVMDPSTLTMACAGTVGEKRYQELRRLSGVS